MHTHPVLRLSQRQLEQLSAYCGVYRAYLWQAMPSTPARNQAVRGIQALQARVVNANTPGLATVDLVLTCEEQTMVRQLFQGATHFYAATPPSEQRIQQLAALTTFRFLIERTLRHVS
jgi:hypothetical protein